MKKIVSQLFVIATILMLAQACTSEPAQEVQHPRNIILIIGDGMGIHHIQAGMTANKGFLNIERMPVTGLIKTYSYNDYITDSGAGGTALATGQKTYNGAIGVGPDSLPLKTILEYASEGGKATGVVSTSSVTHATPASFVSHQKSRGYYQNIAIDFVNSNIDLFIGGGYNDFARRPDSVDLTLKLTEKGFQVVTDTVAMASVTGGKMAGLLAPGHMPKISEGRGSMLAASTRKALELLSQDPDGFFLMIEGSQIDWGGHANETGYVVDEVVDLDRAIGVALDWAEAYGNTLVIVTADHETGAFTVLNGDYATGEVTGAFGSTDHTGVMVPIFATGPYAEVFSGIQENTDVFFKMFNAFNLNPQNNDGK